MAPVQKQRSEELLASEEQRALAGAILDGFRSLALPASGGSTSDVAGVPLWYSSSHVPVFNAAALLSRSDFSRDKIERIAAYFERGRRTHALIAFDALVPDAYRLLSALGYVEYDLLPAMFLEGPLHAIGRPHGGQELEIRRVYTPGDLRVYRTVLGRIFNIPAAELELILGEKSLELEHVHHFLAFAGRNAVATTTLVQTGDTAGIWNVGTVREYRRRGVAEALMRHVLNLAAQWGCHWSTLLASSDGIPLYFGLGYHTWSTVRVFVPAKK